MPLLSATQLVKSYTGRRVVDEVSYEIEAGEIVGLLGRNGAGKTTTFRMTIGMITPEAGRVVFKDRDVTAEPMYKRLLNTDEVALGTLPDDPDFDNDNESDGPNDPDNGGPIAAGPDLTPLGEVFTIALELRDPATTPPVTQNWLPEGGDSVTSAGNSVIVVATLSDPMGVSANFGGPVSFALGPSSLSGRAINDVETCDWC